MDEQAVALLDRIRRFAIPEGPVECRGTWLRQEGEMRFAPDRPWLSFTAEQWFEGDGIDFRWRASVRMAPLVHARVVDSFERGSGSLTARLFGVIPVANARGPETDTGEALRGLAELPWRPHGFREQPCLTWKASAANKLGAAFDDGKTKATVEFDVDAEGRGLKVFAANRPRLVGKTAVNIDWSGTVGEYKLFDGMRVPTVAEVAWHLPEGPFTYWRGRVIDFRALR